MAFDRVIARQRQDVAHESMKHCKAACINKHSYATFLPRISAIAVYFVNARFDRQEGALAKVCRIHNIRTSKNVSFTTKAPRLHHQIVMCGKRWRKDVNSWLTATLINTVRRSLLSPKAGNGQTGSVSSFRRLSKR